MANSKFQNKRTAAEKAYDRRFVRRLRKAGHSERMIAGLLNQSLMVRQKPYSISRSQVRLDLNHVGYD